LQRQDLYRHIRDGLIAADPDGKPVYEANAAKSLDAIAEEERAVKAALGALPEARRKIITSHDAFGYFGKAYGLKIIAPQGVSTESEASAQDVAKIIRQIKEQKILPVHRGSPTAACSTRSRARPAPRWRRALFGAIGAGARRRLSTCSALPGRSRRRFRLKVSERTSLVKGMLTQSCPAVPHPVV
jgi:hypothetical protein